jgi:NADP-dependent 3-hydroxy acid dehydrogenase YdfG
MPYVQISDPNIIDLASWHQVINVVNQHSDAIAALTNNFGLSWSPDYDGDDWSSAFDFGSQIIVYGRSRVNGTVDNTTTISQTINFTQPFSAKPVVTATVYTGTESRYDAVATTMDQTTSSFTLRVTNLPATVTVDTYVTVNWIAIGPK